MQATFPLSPRAISRLPALAGVAAFAVLALVAAVSLVAQVGGDRGIAPVATTTDIEVRGIEVSASGDNPADARNNGWLEAQRLAWAKIDGPEMSDSQLSGLVSAIVVEEEFVGPRRYVARLGVIFDRQRAGSLLGGGGARARSAPMLLLPVTVSGGAATMFETRNPWQRAWAEYQFGSSAIDYVRPPGAGGESLLLTYGQTGRRSRIWWNDILDQFGAADVLVPIVELHRQWPGGPIEGRFTARHGPDNRLLGQFSLRAEGEAQLPAMLNRAVAQFDRLFTRALASGTLRPDPSLSVDNFQMTPEIRALLEQARQDQAEEARLAAEAAARGAGEGTATGTDAGAGETTAATSASGSYSVQVATDDARAFDAALTGLRGTPGVGGVAVSSTAIGGTSVMRVNFAGDLSALAVALRARGWQVVEGTGALAISR